MNQISFKAKIFAPIFTKAPAEEVEKWAKNITASADKVYKHSKKLIKTRKDFDQQIAEPGERGFAKSLGDMDPAFKKQIMINYHANMKRAAKRYFLKLDRAYKTPKYAESIESGKQWYEESWLRYIGPLRGNKKSKIKGLGALGAMVLSADKDLVKFLKPDMDEIIEGNPICVVLPDKMGKFRNDVRNLIIRYGSFIIDGNYYPETIRLGIERLNQLVEQYRTPEFMPFMPNGESHIDFIVIEIPDPNNPDKMIKQLGLEIQVSRI